jgi:hypothetical protein
MSVPIEWIDRIFEKLTIVYGRDFMDRWRGLSIADVKTDWAHELAGFERWPEAIKFALQNMPPDKPPTVLQFREICRKAPAKELPKLPEPKADPDRLNKAIAELSVTKARFKAESNVDHKAWAKRIVARHAAGERINPTSLRFARDALKGQE